MFECLGMIGMLERKKWIVYWNHNDFIFWKKKNPLSFCYRRIHDFRRNRMWKCCTFDFMWHFPFCVTLHISHSMNFIWISHRKHVFTQQECSHVRNPTEVLIEHNNTWWWKRILYKTCIGRCIKNWWIFRCQTIHFSTPFHTWVSVCECCFRWYTFHLPFVSIKLAFHF